MDCSRYAQCQPSQRSSSAGPGRQAIRRTPHPVGVAVPSSFHGGKLGAAPLFQKVCRKCREEKPADSFYRMSKSDDGRQPNCKKCMDVAREEHRKKNPAHTRAKQEERRLRWVAKNKERDRKRRAAGLKRWKAQNADRYGAYMNDYGKRYRKERCARDPAFRLRLALSSRLANVLKGRRKDAPTMALLGCSAAAAKRHLERQFSAGMTWANWGGVWHVDHIRPLAGFDLTDPAQLRDACHFTNLRPLPKLENLAKGAKRVFLI